MIHSRALVLLAAVASVFGAPHLVMRDAPAVTDTEVLQYALTLEHLENAFYAEGLAKLDEKAFEAAGYLPWVRSRFVQVNGHEKTHVDFLTGALGDAAPKPCTYKFPFDDPKSFAALSMALETVGASAYTGAARLLQNKDTLTAAASILNVESRQAAWVSSAVLKGSAWDGPFETPLSMDGVFSIASQFIVSCPDSNPKLPVTALPMLEIEPTSPVPGSQVTFKFDISGGSQLYVAWFDGVTTQFSDLTKDNKATVPAGLQGTVYAAIVKTKGASPSDQELSSGLVMFEIGIPSSASNL